MCGQDLSKKWRIAVNKLIALNYPEVGEFVHGYA